MPDAGQTSTFRRAPLFIAILLAGIAVPCALAVDASQPLALQHLTREKGLPQGTVNDTLQDSRGFVWIATEDGLVRYDGTVLERYSYTRSDPESLPGNFIRDILEDAAGDIWVAIKDGGIARWNRSSDKFTRFRHDPTNPASLSSDAARAMLLDTRGRLWIALSGTGVDVLDPGTGRLERLRPRPGDDRSLIDERVNTLHLNRSGAIWIGTDVGLTRFDSTSLRGTSIGLGQAKVTQILEDRIGRLWVGTLNNGLMQFDRRGKLVRQFRHDERDPRSLAHDDIRAILEDRTGRLWIGTANGLDLHDPATGTFKHFRHHSDDPGALPDSFIMSLYEDSTGLVWIGTRSGGVSRWNPHSWQLGGYRPSWLAGALVTSFADAQDGIWIGSLGGGLMRFHPDNGKAESVDEVLGRRDVLAGSRVMALLLDRRGTLWIGTMAGGLKALSPDGRLRHLPVGGGLPDGTSAAGIMTLYEARDGRIWIGTFGGGANVLNPATGAMRQLPFDQSGSNSLSGANVSAFAEDAEGNLWIGTDGGGLNLVRPDGSLVHTFRHDPDARQGLASNTIYSLAADGNGRIWVGTDGGGLDRIEGSSFDPRSIRFHNLSRDNGLSSDTVYGVLVDARGRLWLSGNSGLMRYDPKDGALKTYHREHGLQGEEFNYNAYFRSRSGHLIFGGPGGFNAFDPARLTERASAPRIVLTGVEVLGVPQRAARPWWLADRIALDAGADIVTLRFAALDFTSPARNRLSYRLRGLSDRWIDLGPSNRVTLTNLDIGANQLEIRAANGDSNWSAKPLTIVLTREAPWWRTPWAYALLALLGGAVVAQRVWRGRRNLRAAIAAQVKLEQEVERRTHELRDTNQRLEDAARVKEGFLARMSHELRTPMNGVIGMTDLLETTPLTPVQHRYTATIRSSAQALLRILNDLLDISKINAGRIELEDGPVDIGALLEECTLLFSGPCKRKNLDLKVEPPQHAPRLRGDALRIRQILINLIGNAVKFTNAGSILVRSEVHNDSPTGARVLLQVTDTGIGIDPKFVNSIFEPFAQADESTSRRFGGTGLGLTICQELAQLMGGDVAVDSEQGRGTTFRVTLKLDVDASAGADATTEGASAANLNLRGRVLIVEDDPVNAAVAEGFLQRLGCSCVWVNDGPSAFVRLGAEAFDLILMDLNMPGMDGFATTAALRHQMAGHRRIPIVALTAHDAAAYRERCLAADMDDILSKPYTLAQCADVVRRWLPNVPPLDELAETASSATTITAIMPFDLLAVIDSATVAGIVNLDSPRQRNLYGRLVTLFEQSAAVRLEELGQALAASDLSTAASICHKLKSAAANVGALAYSNAVRQTEAECLSGNVVAASALHRSLTQTLPVLLANLREHQIKVPA